MKKDNKGFSLVELIVVIAIIAVFIGILVLSLSVLFGVQARECAQKISGQMSETKAGSMSRFDETMNLKYVGKTPPDYPTDGYYVEKSIYSIKSDASSFTVADTETRRVGSSKIVINIILSDGTSFELGEDKSITISYDRASGAYNQAVIDGAKVWDSAGKALYFEQLTFTSGLKTYKIDMIPETGKHILQ